MFEQPEWETETLINQWRGLCQQMNPRADYGSSWQKVARQYYGRQSNDSSLSIQRIVPARLVELESVRKYLNRPAELELTIWLTSAPYKSADIFGEKEEFVKTIFGLMGLRQHQIEQTRRLLSVIGVPSAQASNDERFLHDITNQYLAMPQKCCWNVVTALQRENGERDGTAFWESFFHGLEDLGHVGATLMHEETIFLTPYFHKKYWQFARWNIDWLRQQEPVLTGKSGRLRAPSRS